LNGREPTIKEIRYAIKLDFPTVHLPDGMPLHELQSVYRKLLLKKFAAFNENKVVLWKLQYPPK